HHRGGQRAPGSSPEPARRTPSPTTTPLLSRRSPGIGPPPHVRRVGGLPAVRRGKALSRGTPDEYHSTPRKWEQWGHGALIEQPRRTGAREFPSRKVRPAHLGRTRYRPSGFGSCPVSLTVR